MPATEPLVFDAIRTPRGKGKVNGSLHATKPVDLVVGLMHEMLSRNPDFDPNRVDDVVLGCVSPIGDQGADIAKTAAVKAGLPDTVAGVQLNRPGQWRRQVRTDPSGARADRQGGPQVRHFLRPGDPATIGAGHHHPLAMQHGDRASAGEREGPAGHSRQHL